MLKMLAIVKSFNNDNEHINIIDHDKFPFNTIASYKQMLIFINVIMMFCRCSHM